MYYNIKEIRSLKKLSEMGCENSRAMRRLKRHCLILGKKICLSMPIDRELPEGYKIVIKPNTTNDSNYTKNPVLVNYRKHISISEPVTREMVLCFTEDIANGLLDKFKIFLNKHEETSP